MEKKVSVRIAYIAIIVIWSTTPLGIKWSNEGVGYAVDEHNADLVTAEMRAEVDAAAVKMASGELVVHDYSSDETCPALDF